MQPYLDPPFATMVVPGICPNCGGPMVSARDPQESHRNDPVLLCACCVVRALVRAAVACNYSDGRNGTLDDVTLERMKEESIYRLDKEHGNGVLGNRKSHHGHRTRPAGRVAGRLVVRLARGAKG